MANALKVRAQLLAEGRLYPNQVAPNGKRKLVQTVPDRLVPWPEKSHDGAYVLLLPTEVDQAKIGKMAAEEDYTLHCTSVYLGDSDDLKVTGKELTETLRTLAADIEPFKARLGGILRFTVDNDYHLDPIVLNVDAPRVNEVRDIIVRRMKHEHDIEPDDEHGYTPHLTLGYLPHEEPLIVSRLEDTDVTFDRIRLGFAGEEFDIGLGRRAARDHDLRSEAQIPDVKAMGWDEADHPRGADGKFIELGMGGVPVPKGSMRLFHYTTDDVIDDISKRGLLQEYGRGDGGEGFGNEPSAGIWASTRPPDLYSNDDHKRVVEFHATPDQISNRADYPSDGDWEKFGEGSKHVLMNADVSPDQFVGIHEPWHVAYRYMSKSDNPLEEYAWLLDEDPDDPALSPYIKAYKRFQERAKATDTKDVYAGNGGRSVEHGFGKVQEDPVVQRSHRSALRGKLQKIKKKCRDFESKAGMKPKIRHVRTRGGQEHFDQPIGSIIIADTPLKNIKLVEQFKDDAGNWWTRLESTSRSGKKWDLAESENDGWQVYGVNPRNEDDMSHVAVTNAKTANEAMILLDNHLGAGNRHMPNDPPIQGSEGTGKAELKKPRGEDGRTHAKPLTKPKSRAKKMAEEAAERSKKPAKAKSGTSGQRSVKKPAGSNTAPAKRRGSKPRNEDGLTVAEILKQSGGDREPEDKNGVELSGVLNTQSIPKTGKAQRTVRLVKKKKRDNPADYHVDAKGKAKHTTAMRIRAHQQATGGDIPKKFQNGNEKDFRLAPAVENEYLWFPKSTNSDVAYSYRQEGRDENGQLNGTFGPRRVQYTKEYMERNQAAKEARVAKLEEDMHRLDAKLEKEAVKNDTAAAVALMRVLGIRVNTQSEEQQERTKGERSKARAARLAKSGVDPSQHIYGAATLQARHARIRDDGQVELDFMGKEHVRNTHVTDHPLIVALIKARLKNKKRNEPLFPGVTATQTQQYLRDAMRNKGVMNKDLRTYLANQLALEEMAKRKPPKTQDDFDIAQAEIAAKIAMTLNNAGKQTLTSYISSGLWKEWKDGITE